MIHERERESKQTITTRAPKGRKMEESTLAQSKMDGPTSMQEDLKSLQETMVDTSDSKRRKVALKTVVRVRAESNGEKQKGGEGPPSDSWSWRKYGQKPIKGSPHPRGYYRCSTSKGCSAKKQVERCRADASVLIITYTSDHNHPGPDLPSSINPTNPTPQTQPPSEAADSGLNTPPTINPLVEEAVEGANNQSSTFDEEVGPTPCSKMVASSTSKSSEENDFFDELEELPISSSFTGFVRSSFFDERILLLPS